MSSGESPTPPRDRVDVRGAVGRLRPGRPIRFDVSRTIDLDEWQAITDACPHATFFHTPAWLRAFVRSDPETRIATRVFRFEDGTKAVFPLLERLRFGGLWRTVESTPVACYGGLVSCDSLTEDHVLCATRHILRNFSNLVWRVHPLDPLAGLLDPIRAIEDSTEILDLEPFADDDALRANYRHSVRKQINKACRAGLTARESIAWEEWEEYYRLYETRLRQWGSAATNSHPLALFRALFESRGPSVKLLIVTHQNRIIGGNLNFYHARHCVEWHAAYDSEFFSHGVRDFLVDWIIRDARARGFAWYDFNPSGGHEGTRRFKQSFGTTTRATHVILVRRGVYGLQSARQLLRAIRHLRRKASEENAAETPAALSG